MSPTSESSPLLLATVLLEAPGFRAARQLGKTQVSSLLRFFSNGDIIVWRNFPEPLYPVARVGAHEFDFIPTSTLKKDANLAEIPLKPKLQLAESLIPHACWHFYQQWRLLDRAAAILVIRHDLTKKFAKMFAPDEGSFGTTLMMAGYPSMTSSTTRISPGPTGKRTRAALKAT